MAHPLLHRARASGTPVIQGSQAIWLWQGEQPPHLIGDFNGWTAGDAPGWTRVADQLWSCALEFPRDAYVEYAILAEPDDEARIADPLNHRSTPDGLGHTNNFFYMPGATPTRLTERGPGIPQGRVSRHRVESEWLLATGKRWVHLYSPPTDEATPLIVVYDARDYLTRGRITQIVDNLIAQRRIRPVALALVDNAGPARGVEYACNEATVALALTEVLPLARKHLNLIDPAEEPGAFGVLGASMGGLMALYTGLRAPAVFGHVLSQSAAFELFEAETVVSPLVRHLPVQPVRIWMDVGRFEWLLEPNRRMYGLLRERGYDVTYREYSGGHNYPAWRDDLWRGLEALYGTGAT